MVRKTTVTLRSEASVVVSMNVFVLDINPPGHYTAVNIIHQIVASCHGIFTTIHCLSSSGKDQFEMF